MERSCNAHKTPHHNPKRLTTTERELPMKSSFDGQSAFIVHQVTAWRRKKLECNPRGPLRTIGLSRVTQEDAVRHALWCLPPPSG